MSRQNSNQRVPRNQAGGALAGWWREGLCAAMLCVLITSVMASAQEPAQAPAAAPAGFVAAGGPGADAFQRACVLCHAPDRIVAVRRTRTEWGEVIDTMVDRGAQVTDDNYGPIEEYLLRNYGKVNINRAAKEDLMLMLAVTAEVAEAIVKHRTEHGRFADFEAVVKVPGIDAKKLEDKKDAIIF